MSAGAILLASCGGGGVIATPKPATATPTPASATPKPASVAISFSHVASLSDLAIHVALDRGYLAAEGVNVSLETFRSTQEAIPVVATGQVMGGSGGLVAALFNAVEQGIPLVIAAGQTHAPATYKGAGWMVRQDLVDKVQAPKDLKGLVIALPAPGSVIDSQLDVLLRQGGLTVNDVEIKPVSFPDQVAAMANRSIDVTYTFQPFIPIMQGQKLATLWKTAGEVIPNHQQTVIFYGPALIQQQPEAAKGFMVGYLRGVRDVVDAAAKNNNRMTEDLLEIQAKYGSVKDVNVLRGLELSGFDPDGTANRESLQTDLDYFVRAGFVKTPLDLNKVIDTTYVDYAVSKLGRYKAP